MQQVARRPGLKLPALFDSGIHFILHLNKAGSAMQNGSQLPTIFVYVNLAMRHPRQRLFSWRKHRANYFLVRPVGRQHQWILMLASSDCHPALTNFPVKNGMSNWADEMSDWFWTYSARKWLWFAHTPCLIIDLFLPRVLISLTRAVMYLHLRDLMSSVFQPILWSTSGLAGVLCTFATLELVEGSVCWSILPAEQAREEHVESHVNVSARIAKCSSMGL